MSLKSHKSAVNVNLRGFVRIPDDWRPYSIVITEPVAVLQDAPGKPCVLQWVRRGPFRSTVHVMEDSAGDKTLRWEGMRFAEVVSLQVSGANFRSKECQFKVQLDGITIAKTAVIDLAGYCQQLVQDKLVSVPLTCKGRGKGTLLFTISATPVSEEQQQQQQPCGATSRAASISPQEMDLLGSPKGAKASELEGNVKVHVGQVNLGEQKRDTRSLLEELAASKAQVAELKFEVAELRKQVDALERETTGLLKGKVYS